MFCGQHCYKHGRPSIIIEKTKPMVHCTGVCLSASNHDCLSKACMQGAYLHQSSVDKICIHVVGHACICNVCMYGALHV